MIPSICVSLKLPILRLPSRSVLKSLIAVWLRLRIITTVRCAKALLWLHRNAHPSFGPGELTTFHVCKVSSDLYIAQMGKVGHSARRQSSMAVRLVFLLGVPPWSLLLGSKNRVTTYLSVADATSRAYLTILFVHIGHTTPPCSNNDLLRVATHATYSSSLVPISLRFYVLRAL